MKPTEEALLSAVLQWIAKADMDYRAATRLLDDADPLREPIAFHCQQAVEKYLKALLVSRGVDFPKTHDLDILLDLVMPFAPTLAESLEEVDRLTPYGVKIRYPGDLPGEERSLFALATQARDAVMAELKPFLAAE
jgi:HEPN domain-containing protein